MCKTAAQRLRQRHKAAATVFDGLVDCAMQSVGEQSRAESEVGSGWGDSTRHTLMIVCRCHASAPSTEDCQAPPPPLK